MKTIDQFNLIRDRYLTAFKNCNNYELSDLYYKDGWAWFLSKDFGLTKHRVKEMEQMTLNLENRYIEMINKSADGPKEVIIPEQKYLSCRGCSFYNHTMMKSGFNPIYAHICNHTELELYHKFSGFRGNLNEDKTPDWCPFLIKTN